MQVLVSYCTGVSANLQKRLYLVTKFHTLWGAQTDEPSFKLIAVFGLEKVKSAYPKFNVNPTIPKIEPVLPGWPFDGQIFQIWPYWHPSGHGKYFLAIYYFWP